MNTNKTKVHINKIIKIILKEIKMTNMYTTYT